MIKKLHVFAALVCFAASVAGCAVPLKDEPGRTADLLQGYLQTGKHQEAAGELVTALRNFKLALTIDPHNQEALGSCNRLENEIRSSAKKHYNAGLSLQKRGKYALARKEFLTALRLYPDYEKAREMVTARKRIEIKGHVVHTVKPGETLSKLAELYYGDYRKFTIIARYNNLSDATALRVGQELKIPESRPGELVASKEAAKEEEVVTRASDSQDWEKDFVEAEGKGPTEESELALGEDEMEQVAIYRDHGIELFNDNKYEKALIEFNKVLASNPDDSVTLDYVYKCYFRQAIGLYEQKEYLAARDRFRTSLKYRSECQQCHQYMNNCESSYKQLHYTKGMQFYNEERLDEAIREWELVKKEDPDYKRVNYLIQKARIIQEKLKELKAKEKGE